MKSKTQKKNKILNIVMIVAIVLIGVAGVMTLGSLKGWFSEGDRFEITKADGSVETMSITSLNKIGSANIERNGVAYSLEDGTSLRDGDIIETRNSSFVDISFGKNTLSLDENSKVVVSGKEGSITLALSGGGVFAEALEPFTLRLMDTEVTVKNGVFSASAPYGSGTVFVYENSVSVGEEEVKAGTAANILAGGVHSTELSIKSLNGFNFAKVTEVNKNKALCFTKEDIEALNKEREDAKKITDNSHQLMDHKEQQIEEFRKENENKQTATVGTNSGSSGTASSGNSNSENAESNGSLPDNEATDTSKCTIEIRCDAVLNNMGELVEGKNKYVPSNGTILATSTLSFSEGDTVFDVLKNACTLADIQLEYSWTPMYNSYYVEGINQLYEFDCGNESGWMYKVNGWFPNYGCSSYKINDGDIIVWYYTCKGLGADVGASVN